MKKIKILYWILFLIILEGCINNNEPKYRLITFDVDGKSYVITGEGGLYPNARCNDDNKLLQILYILNTENAYFWLYTDAVHNESKPLHLGTDITDFCVYFNNTYYQAISGTMYLKSVNQFKSKWYIEGKFNFTMVDMDNRADTIELKNGIIKYYAGGFTMCAGMWY